MIKVTNAVNHHWQLNNAAKQNWESLVGANG
jgi:hypothetical protein